MSLTGLTYSKNPLKAFLEKKIPVCGALCFAATDVGAPLVGVLNNWTARIGKSVCSGVIGGG